MATRAPQATQGLSAAQALALIERHGIVCEAARRGATASLVDAIAGETVRANWWSHPRSRVIFAVTRAVRAAPDVLVCRLIEGKITFVHRRLWPALLRLAGRFDAARLARVREVHDASGKHVLQETAFPQWVPAEVAAAAEGMSEASAIAELGVEWPLP